MKSIPALLTLLVLSAPSAVAHDTWVETNTNVIRTGDAVHLDLKLGNHGNEHRDFKLASKIPLDGCTLSVVDPAGTSYDLKDRLADVGYAPTDGYWTAKFIATKPGLYMVAHMLDKVVNHGRPIRSIKSAKSCFVVSDSLDRVRENNPGFDRALGHPLELVPVVNPVTPMGPGQPIRVRVLLKGKPAAEMRVAFIPRGQTLAEGFDEQFERMTDTNGIAAFTPTTGNSYLIVTHHKDERETGDNFDWTAYSATLTVYVPETCPCCTE